LLTSRLSIDSHSTGFVSEVILNELDQKKRTALIKFFVKLTVSSDLFIPALSSSSLTHSPLLAFCRLDWSIFRTTVER